jgi:hypothetical protein
MKHVFVDFKGRAMRVEDDAVEECKEEVMDQGGALLRFDGEDVYEYTGKGGKDCLMLAMRSVGWNLGTWLEYGGAERSRAAEQAAHGIPCPADEAGAVRRACALRIATRTRRELEQRGSGQAPDDGVGQRGKSTGADVVRQPVLE